ncbi:TetR/AcrR family transcriptional regulator [Gordonia sp. (in: high G+C Gram-positive bacteria)]|uniref:TetR/AcrR family transcriptional regulator n=1 Tax=Gordonia sp. (in: high G+C Gram-positive bacteria) TaxID=84139 RepID=UPI0039E4E1BD
MGRAALYSDDTILDAALELVAADGPQGATVVAIAARLGAPSGSIYHRFASRDLLLARLWIRTVERFQEGYLDVLALTDPVEATRAAVDFVLEWGGEHRHEAQLLTMYRRTDLVALWPDRLGEQLATLNSRVEEGLQGFARRRFGDVSAQTMDLARFAVIDVPYGAARQAIRDGRPPSPWLREAVARAAQAALDVQD